MARNLLNTLSSRITVLFVFAALIFAPPPPPHLSLISRVRAATINVDSTCTLDQAIRSANNDSTASGSSCEAGSGADTINISGAHTPSAGSLTAISGTLTIIGTNDGTINGSNLYSLFNVAANGNLTIRNLTLRNGRGNFGGAIYMNGTTLTVENTVIHSNITISSTGGGAIQLDGGNTTIRNSVIRNNTLSNTSALSAGAMNISSTGTTTIENTTFYGNTTANRTGSRIEGILVGNGTTNLSHVTMSGHYNSLSISAGVTINMRNSLITGDGSDCIGTLTSNVGNLIEDNSCSPAVSGDPKLGPVSNGVFPLLAGSPAIDAAVSAHCLSTDQRGTRRPQGKACDIGAYEFPQKSKAKEEEEEGPYIPPTPMPPTYTGEGFFMDTGIRVSATHGLRSGVQFKRIGAANIGLPSVLNNGFIDAVDIFGYVEQGVEVCFPQSGALIFLDAATSPRTVVSWPATIVDGMTCGRIDRPGTLVLVPLGSRLAGPVSRPQPAPSIGGAQGATSLTDCYITTTHILNLRESPGGDVIGRVNYNATLRARGRDGAWYQITVDGLSGWISADFTRSRGNCA